MSDTGLHMPCLMCGGNYGSHTIMCPYHPDKQEPQQRYSYKQRECNGCSDALKDKIQNMVAIARNDSNDILAELQAAREKATQLEEMYSELYEHHMNTESTIASQAEEIERLKEKQVKHGKKIDTWMRRAIAHQANSKKLMEDCERKQAYINKADESCAVCEREQMRIVDELNEKLSRYESERQECIDILPKLINENETLTAKLSRYESAVRVEEVVKSNARIIPLTNGDTGATLERVGCINVPYDLIGKRVTVLVMPTTNEKGENK